MLPERTLSREPVPAPYLSPDDRPFDPLTDYEYGGAALRDPSQGLRVQVWTFRLVVNDVTARAPTVAETTLFTRANITQIAGCFDQNMNPCVAFVQEGELWLWWFDSLAGEQVFSQFSGEQPRVCMDDKRPTQNAANDILFAYLRNDVLYIRTQRDRFGVEDRLADIPPDYRFVQMGMNSVNRVQFQFEQIVED